jgi:hypothetical protein
MTEPDLTMKRLKLALLACLILIMVSGPAIFFWESNQNRGFTWGYYGDFNAVSNTLTAMPGVTILSHYYLEDLTLELFKFDLRVSGAFIELRFPSSDPIRHLRDQRLTHALRKRIEEQKYQPSKP